MTSACDPTPRVIVALAREGDQHVRCAILLYLGPRDTAINQTYYSAEIEITEDLVKLGSRQLKPGMLVDVFIATESRTAISYLVKPITDNFDSAFPEE